jgi:acyl-coenzyme A thioesterase PaaI-like protein
LTDVPAELFRRGINLWPPFLGAGVRVTRVSADYREIDVMLKVFALNRNLSGTPFGGSMFAMTDPFFALMMLMNLGSGFGVEDKVASIRYQAPAHGDVFARFRLAAEVVDGARKATINGGVHEPVFRVEIVDRDDDVVAVVERTLVIRRLESDSGLRIRARNPAPRAKGIIA